MEQMSKAKTMEIEQTKQKQVKRSQLWRSRQKTKERRRQKLNLISVDNKEKEPPQFSDSVLTQPSTSKPSTSKPSTSTSSTSTPSKSTPSKSTPSKSTPSTSKEPQGTACEQQSIHVEETVPDIKKIYEELQTLKNAYCADNNPQINNVRRQLQGLHLDNGGRRGWWSRGRSGRGRGRGSRRGQENRVVHIHKGNVYIYHNK